MNLYDRSACDDVEPDELFLCVGKSSGNFVLKTGIIHNSEDMGYIHVEVFEKLKGKVFDYKIDYKNACIKYAEDEMRSNPGYNSNDFDEIIRSNFEELRVDMCIKAGIIRIFIEQAVIDGCGYRGETPVDNYVTELNLVYNNKKLVLSNEDSYKISPDNLFNKIHYWR